MEKTPDRKTMIGDEQKFIFGRKEDPVDPDRELRKIAASLVVNAKWRDKTQDCGGELFVIRDVNEGTFNKLRAVMPNIIDVSGSKAKSKILKGIKNRMIGMRRSGHPDWNVLRRGDQKKFSSKDLEKLYEDINKDVMREAHDERRK